MAWRWPSSKSTIKSWKDIKQLSVKVSKALDKGKEFQLSRPTSIRSFERNDVTGDYRTGFSQIGKGYPTEVEVASSAVAEVKYDPNKNIASIRFVNGDKWYDYDVTPEEFQEFIDADSKGQWINYIWKWNNRIAGY